MFTITASIKANPSSVAQVRALLAEASNVYVRDPGTQAWLVHQSADVPTDFLIVEVYDNPAALQTHLANPYYAAFMERIKPYAAGLDIGKWNGIEGGAELKARI
ncbi:hypothetical protein PhCBS80983_g03185 [Powellomyces hirtus]|uniref:ABM domain-containing protein n=1 Tax=Powellomyces hirtus TaxID=109895 RepID=A0A507E3E4_9FUNG|nr:hypothetical protein PhCBS80983_g03185 [Powellomyces hirtus]